MKHYQAITLQHYGNEKTQPDVVIWCPHACDGQQFLEKFPTVIDICIPDKQTLLDYLLLEYDFGSEALGIAIAKQLAKKSPKLSIIVAMSQLPRGLVDPARTPEHALRNIFSQTQHHVVDDMLTLQRETVMQIKALIQRLDPVTGLFIDTHSMAPYSPIGTETACSEALREEEGQVQTYIDAYQQAIQHGMRRNIDLITTTKEGQCFADPALSQAFAHYFEQQNIAYDFDKPYSAGAHLLGSVLMQHRRGITVDIPKDYLSKQSVDNPEFDLIHLSLDQEKVLYYADTYSNALLMAHKTQ